jgi:hypothetical protein
MFKRRWLFAFLMIVIGALQAWDSHILQAEAIVQAIVAIGILAPAVAFLVSTSAGARIAGVLVAIALMIVARVVSDVRLPGLALAAFFPAMVVWLDMISARRAECAKAR